MPFFMADCDCCDECCGPCQQYRKCDGCCWCMPKFICVSVSNAEEACSCESASALFEASAGGADCAGPVAYEGNVTCGDLTIDLKFTVESANGCKMFLESSCLGLTGASRASQDLGLMGAPLAECGANELDVTFNVSGATGCGDYDCDALTISVSVFEIFENPIDCDGCSCLPLRFCASYVGDGYDGCEARGEVEWDSGLQQWTGVLSGNCDDPVNMVVSLEEDEYGECGISVEVSGGATFSGEFKAFGDNTCPDDIGVAWDVAGEAEVTVSTKQCTCGTPSPCCGNLPLPRILTVTMQDYDYPPDYDEPCPDQDCSCADGETFLIFDEGTGGVWAGGVDDVCGQELAIRLTCDEVAENFQLEVTLPSDPGECISAPGQFELISQSCDPLELVFRLPRCTECCPEQLVITE